jgi:hypothetical protein
MQHEGSSTGILSLKTTSRQHSNDGLVHPLLDHSFHDDLHLQHPPANGGVASNNSTGSTMPGPTSRQRSALHWPFGQERNLSSTLWGLLFKQPISDLAHEDPLEPSVLKLELAEMMRARHPDTLKRLGGVAGIASLIAKAVDGTDGQALLLGDSCASQTCIPKP